MQYELARVRRKTQPFYTSGVYIPDCKGSSYGELTWNFATRVMDAMGVDGSSVVFDAGAGLGAFMAQATLVKGCRCLGWELNPMCCEQADSLKLGLLEQKMIKSPNKLQFYNRDLTTLSCADLEGVSHLYSLNKAIPPSVFEDMAGAVNASPSIKCVASYLDITRLGWRSFSLVQTIPAKLSGSGEGVSMKIYKKKVSI